MRHEDVSEVTAGVPHMRPKKGAELWQFLVDTRPKRILELGTSHGVSTCYIAAAASEYGGSVTTMDRRGIETLEPNVWRLLGALGLSSMVDVVVAERSFTWELMKVLRDRPNDQFDFCFFDGGHTWDVTGYAFLLVDRLLASEAWILFDDLNWSYAGSPSLSGSDYAIGLPEDEREARQVGLVFDILVANHPDYHEARRDDNWGWAQKR